MRILPNNLALLFAKLRNQQVKGILLHGPNKGLILEIIQQIISKLTYQQVVHVEYSEPLSQLELQLYHQNFFGYQNIVQVDHTTNGLSADLKKLLMEANYLHLPCFVSQDTLKNSGIRKFFEEQGHLVSIACYYQEASSLLKTINNFCSKYNKQIDIDAAQYLQAHLGGDYHAITMELEKIMAFAYDSTTISLAQVQEIGASSDANYISSDICYSFASGRYQEFLQEAEIYLEQNKNVIPLLRLLGRFFINLYTMVSHLQDGLAANIAIRQLAAPIHFSKVAEFQSISQQYSLTEISQIISLLQQAELEVKTLNHYQLLELVVAIHRIKPNIS